MADITSKIITIEGFQDDFVSFLENFLDPDEAEEFKDNMGDGISSKIAVYCDREGLDYQNYEYDSVEVNDNGNDAEEFIRIATGICNELTDEKFLPILNVTRIQIVQNSSSTGNFYVNVLTDNDELTYFLVEASEHADYDECEPGIDYRSDDDDADVSEPEETASCDGQDEDFFRSPTATPVKHTPVASADEELPTAEQYFRGLGLELAIDLAERLADRFGVPIQHDY